MVKQSRNRNYGEGSKAPMLEKHDETTTIENQAFEYDQADHLNSKERQMFE